MQKLYEKSGVNIKNAVELVEKISDNSKIKNFERFGGIIEHKALKDFFLVTTTDGIGSKLTALLEKKDYATIANDLIAMNLNDLACSGAAPLTFVDYISAHTLEPEIVSSIIIELKNQLKLYGCELLGGETSELKNIIQEGKMDIAGFATGLVKKENLLDKKNVEAGDIIIGLCSNATHSNGFSLINYLYEKGELDENDYANCLCPTVVYVNEIIALTEHKLLKACANITGGGVLSNLNRVIPDGMRADLMFSNIPGQPIFEKIYEICGEEAFEVFNMGVGFCLIVKPEKCEKVFAELEKYKPFIFGKVLKND